LFKKTGLRTILKKRQGKEKEEKKRKESEPKNFERRGTAFCNMNRGEKKERKKLTKSSIPRLVFPYFFANNGHLVSSTRHPAFRKESDEEKRTYRFEGRGLENK